MGLSDWLRRHVKILSRLVVFSGGNFMISLVFMLIFLRWLFMDETKVKTGCEVI